MEWGFFNFECTYTCPFYQLREAQLREKRLQQENTTWEMQISPLTFEIKQLSEQV